MRQRDPAPTNGRAEPVALRLGVLSTDFVVRRHRDLLFVHAIDDSRASADQLMSAFHDSPEGAAAAAVTLAAEQLGDDDVHFLVADWTEHLRLTVFGDLVVDSDLPSMPRLSAKSTGTWVERTLRINGPAHVTVSVGSDDSDTLEIDDTTDLRAGIVRCRAFRLDFDPSAATHDEDAEAMIASDPPAADSTDTSSSPERSRSAPADVATILDRIDTSAGPATPPSATDLDALLSRPAADDDATIDLDDLELVTDELGADPSHWQLRFADGSIEAVDSTLVLGRSPIVAEGQRAVVFSCKRMSGSHLRVEATATGLVLTDLGSRNRTWIAVGSDDPVAIDPDVATPAVAGSHVQIGSSVFTIVAPSVADPDSAPPASPTDSPSDAVTPERLAALRAATGEHGAEVD